MRYFSTFIVNNGATHSAEAREYKNIKEAEHCSKEVVRLIHNPEKGNKSTIVIYIVSGVHKYVVRRYVLCGNNKKFAEFGTM